MMESKTSDLDLTNLFQNVPETKTGGHVLEVEGTIPSWLRGSVYFTGTGKYCFENMTVNHFVDGFSMVTRFSFSEKGIILYKKYVKSDALKKAEAAGRPVCAEFFTKSSTDVTKNFLGRLMSMIPENSDNPNHNMFYTDNKLFATNGLQYFWQINPDDLSTIKRYDANKLFGLASITPHPLLDHDGTLYNTGGAVSSTGAKQIIYKTLPQDPPTSGESFKQYKVLSTFPMPRLMHCNIHHNLSMTSNHLILIDMPYFLNLKKLFSDVFSGNHASMSDHIDWDPEAIENTGNKFRLFDKKTGKMIKLNIISSEPFFFLHYVNSYEYMSGEGGQTVYIVIDLISYTSCNMTDMMTLNNLKAAQCAPIESAGNVHRYVIPIVESHGGEEGSNLMSEKESQEHFGATAKFNDKGQLVVSPGLVSNKGIHCGAFNTNYRFKPHRYFYGSSGIYFKSEYDGSITKFDTKLKTQLKWSDGEDYSIGEICFVPSQNNQDEDDGVLICPIQELRGLQRGCVILLDPKNMTEIARSYLPSSHCTYNHILFIPK